MPAWKDYYRILQVDPGADQAALKKAYHKLAVIWHPDRNPDSKVAEERFKSIAEAYAVLSDPGKRSRFDQLGPDAFGAEYGTGDIFQGFDLSDLFREFGLPPVKETLFGVLADGPSRAAAGGPYQDFFAQFGQKPGPRKPADQHQPVGMVLAVTLREAVFGAIKTAALNLGGEVVRIPVTIPRGASDGQTLTVKGRVPGPGGRRNDLMVTVSVAPDPDFRRLGRNILTQLRVTRDELSAGCRAVVPTLEGASLRLTVPAGTRPGTRLRAAGHGAPGPDGRRGDLVVSVMAK
ncbi:MAG: DnaJ domain-containing protein [Deltaproteobacteria bacterium]|nr:DnaJ domain-containing protein [Deltaproteobacteria bacterium]